VAAGGSPVASCGAPSGEALDLSLEFVQLLLMQGEPEQAQRLLLESLVPQPGKYGEDEAIFMAVLPDQNLPLPLLHCSRGGMVSIVSQCSAILPFSTRNRS
jgi:hypothetical protein